MTTQPTQPEAAPSPLTERVSRLEGVAEQVDQRLADHTATLNALQAAVQSLRAEMHAEISRLRADMNRQTLITVGVLGGLMALFNFVG